MSPGATSTILCQARSLRGAQIHSLSQMVKLESLVTMNVTTQDRSLIVSQPWLSLSIDVRQRLK